MICGTWSNVRFQILYTHCGWHRHGKFYFIYVILHSVCPFSSITILCVGYSTFSTVVFSIASSFVFSSGLFTIFTSICWMISATIAITCVIPLLYHISKYSRFDFEYLWSVSLYFLDKFVFSILFPISFKDN